MEKLMFLFGEKLSRKNIYVDRLSLAEKYIDAKFRLTWTFQGQCQ